MALRYPTPHPNYTTVLYQKGKLLKFGTVEREGGVEMLQQTNCSSV
jgi:hypothetical protein